jgi:hypothetical protein
VFLRRAGAAAQHHACNSNNDQLVHRSPGLKNGCRRVCAAPADSFASMLRLSVLY